MEKYELSEGEARLLVAVFEHLKPYYEQAKANKASVVTEMNYADEDIFNVYHGLLEKAFICNLTDQEREIIAQRYGILKDGKFHTTEEILFSQEITPQLNVTLARMRQLEAKALKKIHQYMTELTDEETDKVLCNLQTDVQEYLLDAARAHVAEDSALEEMYERYWSIGTNAINKLKIQQNIRKHRSDDEQHSTF